MDFPKTPYAVLTLVVCLSCQVVISSSLDSDVDLDYYSILVDAGSSSSKLKLYTWSSPKSFSSMPEVKLVNSTKFRTPISDYVYDIEGLGEYVDDILYWGAASIPESRHSSTPILIMATAGMRFLDSDITYRLMSGVREILSNASRNPFAPILHNDVGVISGEEEGVYAWIAANYLRGFFDGNKPVSESVGILEMGGGSTQITFIPDGPLYDGEFQVRLANRRYSLYVHSYLNFGSDAIGEEVIHELVSKMSPSTDELMNPCMLKGDNTTIGGVTPINVFGDGNATECREVLYDVLKPAEGIECQPKPCAIREVYQPEISSGTFYATQAFAYAPKVLDAVREDGTLDLEKMLNGAEELCGMTVAKASAEHPDQGKFIVLHCTMGNYIPRLFQNYGFSLDTDKIILSSKIKSEKIEWALGAMLMKLSDRFASTRGTFSVVCPNKGVKNNDKSSGQSSMGRQDAIQKAVAAVLPLLTRLVSYIKIM